MKKISIIIVTYNSLKYIYDCLEAIYRYNDIGEGLEVIVVDNSSDQCDEMFDGIKRDYSDKVKLIRSGKNGGYGYGNNIGITRSSADKVIVMNPDVRLVTPIISKICSYLDCSEVGMIGVDYVDGSCPYYFKRGHTSLFKNLFFKFFIKRRKYNAQEMFMSGSFLAFDKRAFINAGMFDENLFMFSEEADITNRLLKKGYQVLWCPDIKVRHLAHGRDFSAELNRIRLESGCYYEKKYGVDSEKTYRVTVQTLRIKKIVSKMLFKKDKVQLFSKMLDSIIEFHDKMIQDNDGKQ